MNAGDHVGTLVPLRIIDAHGQLTNLAGGNYKVLSRNGKDRKAKNGHTW